MTTRTSTNNVALRDEDPYFKPMNAKIHSDLLTPSGVRLSAVSRFCRYLTRTILTTFIFWFAHAASRKAISSSRPKTSLPVTGNLATGNFLRCRFCWRLASSDTRSGRGRLLQALARNSTPCVDCSCYRRYRLQKFGRVLETPPWVLL